MTESETPARGVAAIAAETPDRLALVSGDRRIAYAELDAAANRWAQCFAAAGVGHGDRVAVMLGNRPEVFATWYGAARVGAQIVPVSYRFTGSEVRYILEDSEASVFVYEDAEAAEQAVADLPSLHAAVHVDDPEVGRMPSRPPGEKFLGSLAVFMNYTSGTTGRPRASCGRSRVPVGISRHSRSPSSGAFAATMSTCSVAPPTTRRRATTPSCT